MAIPDPRSEGYTAARHPCGVSRRGWPNASASAPQRERGRSCYSTGGPGGDGYPTIKRVLVWGSFVTAMVEPNDLDYTMVVSIDHPGTRIDPVHRRFFCAIRGPPFYGLDRSYLVLPDYPLDYYIERLDFMCRDREERYCGIVEITLRGEVLEAGSVIENQKQLEYSIKALGKMYNLRDRETSETLWEPETRDDVVEVHDKHDPEDRARGGGLPGGEVRAGWARGREGRVREKRLWIRAGSVSCC